MAVKPAARRRDEPRSGEADLCLRLRDGEHAALDELLQREWAPLVGYAEQFTDSVDEAEDVVQRAFVRIWRTRNRLDPDGSLRALLYRTTRNLTIDLTRKRRTRTKALGRLGSQRRPPATPPERLRERELSGAIEEAIAGLSPRRREAFVLCRMHGLSHREVAETLDLSPQTVSNHVSAALRAIRAAISPRLD